MDMTTPKRIATTALLTACALVLSGCLILPGKFSSELILKQGGEFAFSYDGEIHFLGLTQLAQMEARNDTETFTPTECYDDDTGEERECTADETANQRMEWDLDAAERAKKGERQAKQMAAMMGGIDPSDPEAATKLEQLLLRHKGWNKVTHMGDGKFDVEYAIAGELTHDMMFPVIEGFQRGTMFVEAIVRQGNVVRVNATGLAPPQDGAGMSGMMTGMAGFASMAALSDSSDKDEKPPEMPFIDGTFSIVTDGQILANNTDEGPVSQGAMQRLTWQLDQQTKTAPTALVRLAP
jgi:hypothetical protein